VTAPTALIGRASRRINASSAAVSLYFGLLRNLVVRDLEGLQIFR